MTAGAGPPPPPRGGLGEGPGRWDGDPELVALAGEYVLGVLPARERAWVERERAADPALDGLVADWEARLHPLDEAAAAAGAVPPGPGPDPELWARIAASLDRLAAEAAAPLAATPPARPRAVPRRAGPGPLARLEARVWSSLGFWRPAGIAATAAALLLALAGPALRPPPAPGPPAEPPDPVALAVLEGPGDGRPGWLVEVLADGRLRAFPLAEAAAAGPPPGRSLELWTLRDPAEGPLSLGLIPAGGRPAPLPHPALGPGVAAGQLFEISAEPPAGSPVGRPTGPVLFIGRAYRP